MAFNADSPFLHLNFLHSTCVLYVSILSNWIPRYVRLFVRCVSDLLSLPLSAYSKHSVEWQIDAWCNGQHVCFPSMPPMLLHGFESRLGLESSNCSMWHFFKLVARGFLQVLRFPPLLHRFNDSANKISSNKCDFNSVSFNELSFRTKWHVT